MAVVFLAAMAAVGAEPSASLRAQEQMLWPALQGGAAHLGVAPDGTPGPAFRIAWRARRTGGLSAAVVMDETAYAVGRSAVVAVDAGTGEEAWSLDRAEGPIVAPAIAPADGEGGLLLFVEGAAAGGAALRAVDVSSRQEAWRADIGEESHSAPVVIDGSAVVGSRDRSVYSVDLDTGAVNWKVSVDGFVDGSPAAADGRVFVVSENADTGRTTLLALRAQNGQVLWRFSPGSVAVGSSSPSVFEDTVYAGFGDQTIRAVSAAEGTVRWESRVRSPFSSLTMPAVAGGSVYVGDASGSVYRVDAQSGELVWDHQLPGLIVRGAPLVVGPDVVVGLEAGLAAAIRASSGRLVWRDEVADGSIGALAPAGRLLLAGVAGDEGGLVALEHDPDGPLRDERSPSELRPVEAVLNYAAAVGIMLAGVLVLSRLFASTLTRRTGGHRTGARAEPGPTIPEDAEDT